MLPTYFYVHVEKLVQMCGMCIQCLLAVHLVFSEMFCFIKQ